MATSADTDKNDDGAQPEALVEKEFSDAFAEFAKAPDAEDDEPEDEGDDAGDGAGDGDDGEKNTEGGEAANDKAAPADDGDDDEGDGAKAADVAAGKAKSTDDIWANASPEQRAAFEAAQAELDKLKNKDSTARGRFSAIDRKLAALREAAHKADDAVKIDKIDKITGSDEFKGFLKDYPEAAKQFSDFANAIKEQAAETKAAVQALGKSAVEAAISDEIAILADAHGDWFELSKLKQFGEWASKQTGDLREKIDRNWNLVVDGKAAVDVFKAFKQATGRAKATEPPPKPEGDGGNHKPAPQKDAKTQAKLDATKGPDPKGKGGPVISGDTGKTEFEASFDRIVAKRERQSRAA